MKRNTENVYQNLWNAVKDGFINEGWQGVPVTWNVYGPSYALRGF